MNDPELPPDDRDNEPSQIPCGRILEIGERFPHASKVERRALAAELLVEIDAEAERERSRPEPDPAWLERLEGLRELGVEHLRTEY